MPLGDHLFDLYQRNRLITCMVTMPVFLLSQLVAQNDSSSFVPSYTQDQIESYLENLDTENEFDFNDLEEQLQQYSVRPLVINRADENDLKSLDLLSDIQINDLLNYRSNLGDLKSVYELQVIPSFDLSTIERILPFITLEEDQLFKVRSFSKMLTKGRNELFLRHARILEDQRGYQSMDGKSPRYLGDPNHYYIRYKHQFEQNLSYGFTLEKDPGEPFFRDVNKKGFDYQSFHLFARDLGSIVETLALGDYAISLGQGLIMHSGYGAGKSSFVTQIKRGGSILRPYTSVNESALLRGTAVTLRFKPLRLTLFASQTKQDGNIQLDSLDHQNLVQTFSSLQLSGLHRTTAEIEDKDAIRHHLLGGRVEYKNNRLQVGLNALHNRFNQPFQRNILPYNQFFFNGLKLNNASMDYAYRIRNINLFGETAVSDNGSFATIHGALFGLSRYIDLSVLYRNISPGYQALQASPFIESTQANNEKGIYLGTQIKLNSSFWISIYGDYWKHPWLRFNVDAPSSGKEHLIRLTYYRKRSMEAYIQWRSEHKQNNYRTDSDQHNHLFLRERKYLRLHFTHKIHKNLELRNRIEFSSVTAGPGLKNRGFLIYQDILFRSIQVPLSFTARLSYFDADDYQSRIYTYENDILYSFSIPAFYNEGMRYYLNLRYRINQCTLEARFEQTRYRNLDSISSGNELIEGNTRSRIKIQCKLDF